MPNNAPRLLSSGELATLIGVDPKSIHNYINKGLLRITTETLGGQARFDATGVIDDFTRAGKPIPEPLRAYAEGRAQAQGPSLYWLRRASTEQLRAELSRRAGALS